jgi:hypothetical protein
MQRPEGEGLKFAAQAVQEEAEVQVEQEGEQGMQEGLE